MFDLSDRIQFVNNGNETKFSYLNSYTENVQILYYTL